MSLLESVRSKDGTKIAFERRGHGPPLVMIHGTTVDRTRWGGVVGKLAEYFTLCLVDRRGRGDSGDGPSYRIEREFEDVVAVVESQAEPAFVFGHSYGAICSLEAARMTPRIAKLLLYEPPLPLPGQSRIVISALVERLERFLAAGDRDAIVTTFMREVIRLSDDEIDSMRKTSTWAVRLRAAHTIPREMATANHYQFAPEAFADLRVPTLFVLGSRSPVFLQAATRMASEAIAGSKVEELRGHGHAGMSTGPTVFLEKVLPFLLAPSLG
jgi:pimeloyl-ACP methyl ester carboxylesterase